MSQIERLSAKVKAVNEANKYAITLFSQLTAIFALLLGKDILKNDGTLLAKYQALLPVFPSGSKLRVYRSRSDYSLAWVVNAGENAGDHWIYHETHVYIGSLEGKTLNLMTDDTGSPFSKNSLCPIRTNYTVQEIQGKREFYKVAKEVADKALSDLYPFGEYER
jgi:hypothetical protein